MNISNNGIRVLKNLEGCVLVDGRHVIYDDATGQPVPANMPLPVGATIGYGHLIKRGENFNGGIDENRATELLRCDVSVAEQTVQKNIVRSLTQNQFDALVIFAFNIGGANFAASTVVKYINDPNFISGRYPTLESAWRAWNKSRGRVISGLNKRRDAEWKLFCDLV